MMDPKRAAVEQFVEHVAMHQGERQQAKDSGRKFVPTNEQRVQRERLMRQMLIAFGTNARGLMEQLGTNHQSWYLWRRMDNVPSQRLLAKLECLAGGDVRSQSDARELLERATPAMLNAFGIRRDLIEELEWLQQVQQAAGYELPEVVCRAMIEGHRRQANSSADHSETA